MTSYRFATQSILLFEIKIDSTHSCILVSIVEWILNLIFKVILLTLSHTSTFSKVCLDFIDANIFCLPTYSLLSLFY